MKRYSICTPRCNKKNELILFRRGKPFLPPNSGAQRPTASARTWRCPRGKGDGWLKTNTCTTNNTRRQTQVGRACLLCILGVPPPSRAVTIVATGSWLPALLSVAMFALGWTSAFITARPRSPPHQRTHTIQWAPRACCNPGTRSTSSMVSCDQLAQLEMSVRLCMDPSVPRRRLSSAGMGSSVY